jgi:alpha-1,3-rhamnosyltransferase
MATNSAVLTLADSLSILCAQPEEAVRNVAPKLARGAATVSVMVPSYNHACFIGRCLRSIINQSLQPLELIVIDDGSKDSSLEVIENILKSCPFDCELIARSHKGLTPTLNEGIELSRGQYFAYLASDDVWLPSFLESRVACLQARPDAVLAYGHSFVINENDEIVECSGDWARYSDGNVRHMLLHHIVPFSPSVLYRGVAVKYHRWNESAGLEDYDMYLRLSAQGAFAFDPKPLCAWRSHRYNQSRNLDFMLEECLKAQRNAISSLNIGDAELRQAHSELKWRYAMDFIKAGQKRKALGLLCQNLAGAPSYTSVVRSVAGLLLPKQTLCWRRRFVQRRAVRCYGSLAPSRFEPKAADMGN